MENDTEPAWREHPTMPGIRVSPEGRVQTRWLKVRPNCVAGECMAIAGEWRDAGVGSSGVVKYPTVCLFTPTAKRRWKNYTVHRLVMQTFVGPQPPGKHVCHNDGNPQNSHLDNLRYDTPKGNAADTARHNRRPTGSTHGRAKLNESQVRDIVALLDAGTKIAEICRRYHVSRPCILCIRDGKTWSHVTGRVGAKPLSWSTPRRPRRVKR